MAPVSSHPARSETCAASAALLSATISTTGTSAARANSGVYSARAVEVSPETRLRPRARARCLRACSKEGECSRSASRSRTKGRIIYFQSTATNRSQEKRRGTQKVQFSFPNRSSRTAERSIPVNVPMKRPSGVKLSGNQKFMLKPIAAFFAAILAFGIVSSAQLNLPENPPTNTPPVYGPFNAVFLPGGDGLQKSLTQNDTVLQADSPWTLFAWIKPSEAPNGHEFVAGFGDPEAEYSRYLTLAPGKLILWGGQWSTHANTLEATVILAPNQWHFIAATFDGRTFHLYSDGAEVASGPLVLGSVSNMLDLAPPMRRPGWSHFGGKIA